jgi:hypothetical protein
MQDAWISEGLGNKDDESETLSGVVVIANLHGRQTEIQVVMVEDKSTTRHCLFLKALGINVTKQITS